MNYLVEVYSAVQDRWAPISAHGRRAEFVFLETAHYAVDQYYRHHRAAHLRIIHYPPAKPPVVVYINEWEDYR